MHLEHKTWAFLVALVLLPTSLSAPRPAEDDSSTARIFPTLAGRDSANPSVGTKPYISDPAMELGSPQCSYKVPRVQRVADVRDAVKEACIRRQSDGAISSKDMLQEKLDGYRDTYDDRSEIFYKSFEKAYVNCPNRSRPRRNKHDEEDPDEEVLHNLKDFMERMVSACIAVYVGVDIGDAAAEAIGETARSANCSGNCCDDGCCYCNIGDCLSFSNILSCLPPMK